MTLQFARLNANKNKKYKEASGKTAKEREAGRHGATTSFAEIHENHLASLVAKWSLSKPINQQRTTATTKSQELLEKFGALPCTKTGNDCAFLTIWDIESLIRVHGFDRAETFLTIKYCQTVDPIWIYTDKQGLQKLLINDPIGYYVYALSLAFGFSKPTVESTNFKYQLNIALRELLSQKQNTQHITEIFRVNEWLRRILFTFSDKQFAASGTNPALEIQNYLPDNILPIIKTRLCKAISQTGMTGPNGTVPLAAVSNQKYTAGSRHSAFASSPSTRSVVDHDIAEVMLAFNDIFNNPCKPDLGVETDMQIRKFNHKLEEVRADKKAKSIAHTLPIGTPITIKFGNTQ